MAWDSSVYRGYFDKDIARLPNGAPFSPPSRDLQQSFGQSRLKAARDPYHLRVAGDYRLRTPAVKSRAGSYWSRRHPSSALAGFNRARR